MSDSDSPDYEYERGSDGSERNSDSEDYDDRAESAGDEDENASAGRSDSVSAPQIQMCPKHPPGKMIEVCKGCSTILEMVRPEIATQLVTPTLQSIATRYSSRSDVKPPSMVLSESPESPMTVRDFL